MVELLLSWIVMAVAVYLAAALLPGLRVKSVGGAFMAAAVIGFLNATVRWVLFVALGIGTLGLSVLLSFITLWVLNAVMLKLAAALTDSLEVDSFGWALGGAAVISVLGNIGGHLVG